MINTTVTTTVPCPECRRPAIVLDRFWSAGTNGPVGYLRIRCDGLLSFLVAADEIDTHVRPAGLPAAA